MSPYKAVLRCCAVFCLLLTPAYAQFSSAIQGTITDTSAAVVPGAVVRVTNVTTGITRDVTSMADGTYRVLSLPPGSYRITVEKAGFRTAQRDSFEVETGQIARLDFQLALGAVNEVLNVTDQPPLVETEQGRVSGRIEQAEIQNMPLNGRNVYNLLAVQPGIAGRGISSAFGASSIGNDSFAGESGPQVFASGQRYESNGFSVDDVSTNGNGRGGVSNLTPNPDSVQEVRVVGNNFSAVDGRSSGAQIQIYTKSGTNQLHGGASYYFQNNTLAARNTFEAIVPVFRRNEFGYFVGGPIVRNRTFFFTSYEGLRQSGGRAQLATVETPAFRDFVLRTRPNSIAAQVLRDFKPMLDPTSNFKDLGSPAPGPNSTGPADGIMDVGTAQFVPETVRRGNQFSGRIDHDLRPGKDRLYGNYYRTIGYSLTGGLRPAFNRPGDETTNYANLNYTHIFGPTILNELRAGFMRLVGQPSAPPRPDIPQMVITGLTGFSTNSYPSGWYQDNFQYKDILSWARSAHSLKIGGELRRMRTHTVNTTNFIPQYTFATILNFANDEPIQVARNVDPRTGIPATNDISTRAWEWALFVNDDWKVSRRLTMNVGLRLERFGTLREIHENLRNLIFGNGSNYAERLASGKVDIVHAFYPTPAPTLAPRFGFAWDPRGNGRTSVRGGYGIAYDRLFMGPVSNYASNPPLRATAQLGYFYGTAFNYTLGDTSKPYFGYPIDPALRLGLDSHNGIVGSRVAVRVVDPNFKQPYTHNWFLGVQQQFAGGIVVEVSYMGSAGHHLLNVTDVNRFRGDMLDNHFDGINSSFAAIQEIESTSNSSYHGGTIGVKRRFERGFSLSAAYTFSKAIDDSDELYSIAAYPDIANRSLNRGLASYDVPQKLSIVSVWEMPFFQNSGNMAKKLLAGWHLSGSAIFDNGLPMTVTTTAPWPRGDYNADAFNVDRPNAPTSGVQTGGWSRSEFLGGIFKASDFGVPVPGTNGSLGRNTYRGPGFAQVDLSIAKRFAITERISTQFRFDAFNALNRVNLGSPVMDLSSSSFGRSTTALTPRLMQAGLRVEF